MRRLVDGLRRGFFGCFDTFDGLLYFFGDGEGGRGWCGGLFFGKVKVLKGSFLLDVKFSDELTDRQCPVYFECLIDIHIIIGYFDVVFGKGSVRGVVGLALLEKVICDLRYCLSKIIYDKLVFSEFFIRFIHHGNLCFS